MLPLTIFFAFVVGALTVVAVEVLGVLYLLRRLSQRAEVQEAKVPSTASSGEVCRDNYDLSYPCKQGLVWVLEIEKVPKTLTDKRQREQKRNKGIVEVTPVRKHAKVSDQLLILTESDGSHTKVLLKGCTIEAVSATSLSSRKWAKRYPIKVESKKLAIYHGSRTLYIYLSTSWEKESWCNALRLASCDDDKQKLKWFAKLRSDFQSYLTSLNKGYPSLLKPSTGYNEEAIDKFVKVENSSSKVRVFLKKLAKKASKSGLENTLPWDRDERRISAKSTLFKDSISTNGSVKPASSSKSPNFSDEEDMVTPSFSSSTRSGSPFASDDKIFGDEGTLCFNLLVSRLFFDAKSNAQIKNSIQARIQRMLSNMRIPSYIGEITCTGVHTGNLPPHIRGMRVLPSDMNEGVAVEIDFEYSGGVVLDVTTRIEVRELEADNTSSESSSVGDDVTSDLLEGFEYFQKELKLSEGTLSEAEQKDEGDAKLDEMKTGKSTTQGSTSVSKWKCIVNSLAKQVSQVPLSLTIKVVSFRGTLQLHIKSPPSDQLWFGFTAMPDIDFNLESSFGDHKITSGHIASLLFNRFKAAIRDTMVLPNCECVGIPWMLAEKDDWVPREVAPFIWISKEPVIDSTAVPEVSRVQPGEATDVQEASKVTGSSQAEAKHNKAKKVEFVDRPNNESSESSSSGPSNRSTLNEKASQELTTPLLKSDEPEEENPESQSTSRSLVLADEENNHNNTEREDLRPRRIGTRARMLGLGKKMGEKLEEKRRHLEEKGKIIVERMREKPENK